MGYRFGHVGKERALSLEGALYACTQNGDQRGKEYVYKKYYGYIAGVVRRYIKDEYEREELVNEAFVKAFNNLSKFQIVPEAEALERSFKAWIARIAANLCIDLLRSKKKVFMLEDVSEAEIQPVQANAAEKLMAEDIMKLLDRLPEIQRTIFNLYELEGYSHEEIGKLLAIPDSTSRTYLTRAKQRLRKMYLALT